MSHDALSRPVTVGGAVGDALPRLLPGVFLSALRSVPMSSRAEVRSRSTCSTMPSTRPQPSAEATAQPSSRPEGTSTSPIDTMPLTSTHTCPCQPAHTTGTDTEESVCGAATWALPQTAGLSLTMPTSRASPVCKETARSSFVRSCRPITWRGLTASPSATLYSSAMSAFLVWKLLA